MKKIAIKTLLLIFFTLIWTGITHAAKVCEDKEGTKVQVTEYIPWVCCEWPDAWPFICYVKPWFWTVMTMMGKVIQYFVFLASLWGVLFIVINGIMYSMGWADQSLKDESKKRIVQTLIGLALLFLSWVILNLIAPWIWVL
jgi:lysylphosphatidylglycerol synthetase-like protein (DUF2156 family)